MFNQIDCPFIPAATSLCLIRQIIVHHQDSTKMAALPLQRPVIWVFQWWLSQYWYQFPVGGWKYQIWSQSPLAFIAPPPTVVNKRNKIYLSNWSTAFLSLSTKDTTDIIINCTKADRTVIYYNGNLISISRYQGLIKDFHSSFIHLDRDHRLQHHLHPDYLDQKNDDYHYLHHKDHHLHRDYLHQNDDDDHHNDHHLHRDYLDQDNDDYHKVIIFIMIMLSG